jgi:hypothetical protein
MKTIYYILLSFLLVSCNDWLDVPSTGQVDEDKMFADERGFQGALAGSYSQLASTAAYGLELTAGFPDEIACYWKKRSAFYDFNYADLAAAKRLSTTWNKMYEIIANLNLLLDHAKKWDANSLPRYNLIVGEAKGLRAYLHLDLLRLFGPVLPDGLDSPSIPYRDEFSNNIVRLMPARDVLARIETDLVDACQLLQDDPVKQLGRENNTLVDNSSEAKAYAYLYRGVRMNYYAANATLARLYLLTGNKPAALKHAREVIDATTIFQLGNAKSNAADYMYQPELVWAIHDAKIADKLGSSTTFGMGYPLDPAFRTYVYAEGYGIPDDSRLNHWWARTGTTPALDYLSKYIRTMDGTTDVTKWKPVISMIRLSELHYIAAEALLDTDLAEARRLLQAVRDARNLSASPLPTTLTRNELMEQIVLEQLKEFWGEGKLFYTYKRLAHDIIIRQSTIPFSRAIFELPLPTEEIEYGNN